MFCTFGCYNMMNMEILIIIALILLNGIFAMSEIAIVSARKSKLSNEAKDDNKSAQVALKLINNPDHFLSTVQVGITLIGILTGIYSGDVLAVHFSPLLQNIGIPPAYTLVIAKISIVIIVTYLTIIFGELVPKRIGLSSAEKISKIIARPMNWLSTIAYPFVWILAKSTSFIFSLLGIKDNDSGVTEEEIRLLVREGTQHGEVQIVEQNIVERVFSLGDRNMMSIMTPRSEIVWINANMSVEEIRNIILNTPFDKYPVAEKNLDDILGVAFLKDIFVKMDSPDFSIREVVQPVSYFYENMEVYPALEKMKSSHIPIVFINDEFGSVQGIVTMRNIMEALVGEMPEINEEPEIIEREDGSYFIDGQCSFFNFLNYFQMSELYSKYEYNTLSGLILDKLKQIPKTGDQLRWKSFIFEIADMDGARIDKLLVRRI